MSWTRSRGVLCCALISIASIAKAAPVETLNEALTAAYLFNPTLKSARAQLRATDNGVARAKAGYRPTITVTLQDGFEDQRTRSSGQSGYINVYPDASLTNGRPAPLNRLFSSNGTYNPRSAAISLQQNLFDGFRTYNSVKGAEALVEAGREDLRASEQSLLLNAATAYMNVVRDQAIIRLRQNNIKVLTEQLRATEDRQKVGEVTITDVAQARSSLANAQADLSIAQGTFFTSAASFAQYIGHPPGTLRDPGLPARLIPRTLEAGIAVAISENPGVLGAIFRERAQQHTVKQTKGQLLPTASVSASYTKGTQTTGPNVDQSDDLRETGTLTIPLYEAGNTSAQIREAIETLSQRRQQIDEQRELARANLASSWGQLVAARGNIAAGQAAVEANRISLEGVRSELRVGQRTFLDALNAEQQRLNAEVNLVSYRRDLVVAAYGILSAMGRLTASDIALKTELYDPSRYYGEVKDAWYGWGASVENSDDPRVVPVTGQAAKSDRRPGGGPAYTQTSPQIP